MRHFYSRGAVMAAFALAAVPALAQEAPPAAVAKASLLPQDLSVLGMFGNADRLVQGVMLGLMVASVITWTVLLAKGIEVVAGQRRVRRALAATEHEAGLTGLKRRIGAEGPGAAMVAAALAEMTLSAEAGARGGLKDRIASRLGRIEAAFGRRMVRGTGLLATIGATAPFVGLFGTVWGIMNSFIGIAHAQSSSLAVVAPGIAEALLATAAGLVAAIPAVVIYNGFARAIGGYRAALADLSAAVLRTAGRDLESNQPRLHLAAE